MSKSTAINNILNLPKGTNISDLVGQTISVRIVKNRKGYKAEILDDKEAKKAQLHPEGIFEGIISGFMKPYQSEKHPQFVMIPTRVETEHGEVICNHSVAISSLGLYKQIGHALLGKEVVIRVQHRFHNDKWFISADFTIPRD